MKTVMIAGLCAVAYLAGAHNIGLARVLHTGDVARARAAELLHIAADGVRP